MVALPAAHAELGSSSLEGSHLLELRGRGLESKVERLGVQPPIVLWSAVHAAVGACTNPIEARRIHDRQRFEHHRINEGEDGGRYPIPRANVSIAVRVKTGESRICRSA